MAKIVGGDEAVVTELRSLKLLLVMQLLRSGVKQSQIAATLGISDATMSRMLPKGTGKNLGKKHATDISSEAE